MEAACLPFCTTGLREGCPPPSLTNLRPGDAEDRVCGLHCLGFPQPRSALNFSLSSKFIALPSHQGYTVSLHGGLPSPLSLAELFLLCLLTLFSSLLSVHFGSCLTCCFLDSRKFVLDKLSRWHFFSYLHTLISTEDTSTQ